MQKPTIFKVYNSSRIMCYKVATTTRTDNEILEVIIQMYDGMKNLYKVYKNDELIHVINSRKRVYNKQRILEVNSGKIFKDLTEMKEVLLLDRKKALDLVKRSFNYRYV
jgi:hypothetical protein